MADCSPEFVRAALAELGVSQTEIALEWDVSARQVRRWCQKGCRLHIAVCFDAMLRLKRAGLPWRKNEISIAVHGGEIIQLTDAEAVARFKSLKLICTHARTGTGYGSDSEGWVGPFTYCQSCGAVLSRAQDEKS